MSLDLNSYNERDFVDVVNRDVREVSSEDEYNALRSPETVEKWYDALLTFKRDLEYQFSTNRSNRATKYAELKPTTTASTEWAEWLAENEHWRTGALKFYRGVERRLHEAGKLVSTQRRRDLSLHAAIARHREEILNADDDVEMAEFDNQLWEAAGLR